MAVTSPTISRPLVRPTGVTPPTAKAPLSVVSASPVFGCQNHPQTTQKSQKPQPQIDEIPKDKNLGTLQKWCLQAIQWYQRRSRWVDEKTGETKSMFPCPYCPSCSKYTFHAIAEFGVVKGILMGAWRILKCNPITLGWNLLKYRFENGKWPEKVRGFIPDTLPKAQPVVA